jgi:hypothetical protein
MYHPFSILETLKSSWDVLRKNFAVIAVYSFVSFLTVLICALLVYFFYDDAVIAAIGFFVLLVVISYNFLGFIKLIFQLIDNQYYEFEFADIMPKIRMVGSYLILLIMASTLTVILSNTIQNFTDGTTEKILSAVNTYIFQFFFVFYFPLCTCYIVDDQSGPWESLMQSLHLIRGNVIKYLVLFLIIEAIIVICSFTVVGLVFIVPMVNILLVVTYRKLVYSHMDIDDDVAETD